MLSTVLDHSQDTVLYNVLSQTYPLLLLDLFKYCSTRYPKKSPGSPRKTSGFLVSILKAKQAGMVEAEKVKSMKLILTKTLIP